MKRWNWLICIAAAVLLFACGCRKKDRPADSSAGTEPGQAVQEAEPEPVMPEFHLPAQDLYRDGETVVSLTGKSELDGHVLRVFLNLENRSDALRSFHFDTGYAVDGLTIPGPGIGYEVAPGTSREAAAELDRGALELAGIGEIRGMAFRIALTDENMQPVSELPLLKTEGYGASEGDYSPVKGTVIYQKDSVRITALGARDSSLNYRTKGERLPEEYTETNIYLLVENGSGAEITLDNEYLDASALDGTVVQFWPSPSFPARSSDLFCISVRNTELRGSGGAPAVLVTPFVVEAGDGIGTRGMFRYTVEGEELKVLSGGPGWDSGKTPEGNAPAAGQAAGEELLYKDSRYEIRSAGAPSENADSWLVGLRAENLTGEETQFGFGFAAVNGLYVPSTCVMTSGDPASGSDWQLVFPKNALACAGIETIREVRFDAGIADAAGNEKRIEDLRIRFGADDTPAVLPEGQALLDDAGASVQFLRMAEPGEGGSGNYEFYFAVRNRSERSLVISFPEVRVSGQPMWTETSSFVFAPHWEGVLLNAIPESGLSYIGVTEFRDAEFSMQVSYFGGQGYEGQAACSFAYSAEEGRVTVTGQSGSGLSSGQPAQEAAGETAPPAAEPAPGAEPAPTAKEPGKMSSGDALLELVDMIENFDPEKAGGGE